MLGSEKQGSISPRRLTSTEQERHSHKECIIIRSGDDYCKYPELWNIQLPHATCIGPYRLLPYIMPSPVCARNRITTLSPLRIPCPTRGRNIPSKKFHSEIPFASSWPTGNMQKLFWTVSLDIHSFPFRYNDPQQLKPTNWYDINMK